MAVTTNTKATLDTMFKRSVADKVNKLMPTSSVIQKLYPSLEAKAKLGREYLCPVALTFEHGITYGDDTAFLLNAPVAGVYAEAKLSSAPVILRSQVSQSAANRLANDDKAFLSWAGLRAEIMKTSLAKRAELSMLYGGSGLATVASVSGQTITISAATFSGATWGGMETASIDIWAPTGNTRRLSGQTALPGVPANSYEVQSVDPTARTITVVGTLTGVTAGDVIWLAGSRDAASGNVIEMLGMDAICRNTGSLFGINATTYQLWRAGSYNVGGAITFGHILKAAAIPVVRGGAEGEAILFISPDKYETLNSDYSAYRATDASYKAGKGINGVESLEFHYQAGMINIMPHPFCNPGDGFLFNKDSFQRIGATDLTFDTNVNGEGEFFLPLANNAGYELRCQYDFSLFCNSPAKVVKLTNIA